MNIVWFGQQNWSYCWTGKQQLATRLAARGHRVLYVDPNWRVPVRTLRGSLDAVRGDASSDLRELRPGSLSLYGYSYVPALGWRRNVSRRQRRLRQAVRDLQLRAPVALATRPDVGDLIDVVEPRASVYYAVDEWTGFGALSERDRASLRSSEEGMLQRVDVALAVSPRLVARFKQIHPRAHLLTNGADTAHFAPVALRGLDTHPALAALPRPRLCFVGQIDERLDRELLCALATARPDWSVALVGRVKPGFEVGALARQPNVHVLGYHPYEELPHIIAGADVCLLPYVSNELTESCDPLKVYEYVAAGKPVVATPLEGLGTCRSAVTLARGPRGFEQAIQHALAAGAAECDRRLEIARRHDWEARVDELALRLEEAIEVAQTRGRGTAHWIRGADVERLPGGSARYDDYGFHRSDRPLNSLFARAAFHATCALGRVLYGGRRIGRLLAGRPARVRRILVVRHSFLGDLVVFTPTLEALRERYPEAHIVLGVQKGMAVGALLEGSRIVDEIRELDFLSAPTRRRRFAGMLRLLAEGYDSALFGLGFFLQFEAFFCGAPRRVGLYNGHPWQRLHTAAVPLDLTRHELDCNLDLVEVLTGKPEPRRLPRLWMDERRVDVSTSQVVAALGLPPVAPLLLVHAGGRKASRRWPPGRFAELIRRLLETRPGLHVVMTGVDSERPVTASVVNRLPRQLRARTHDAAGSTDLPALVGLLRRASAAVCNDSGVMHLARTLGTPLVALLGPENDARWGPYPNGSGAAVALRKIVPCAPCSRKSCEFLYCMRSLAVDDVLGEVGALIDSDAPAATRGGRGGEGDPTALRTKRWRLDWTELAATGHALPDVAVIDPSPAATRRLMLTRGRACAQPQPVAQHYPRLRLLSVHVAGEPPTTPSSLLLDAVETDRAWLELAAKIDATLIALAAAGETWGVDEIGAHVAALVRQPLAVASVAASPAGAPRPARVVMRRAAVRSVAGDWQRDRRGARQPLVDWLAGARAVMFTPSLPARGREPLAAV